MGIFDKLFGKKSTLLALDPASAAAECLLRLQGQLEILVKKIHDHIELVPAEDALYVYIGKPPGTFGMVWFENGIKVNFKYLARDKGLSQRKIQILSAKLSDTYEKNSGAVRYMTTIAGKSVIVTPSESFADEIKAIIIEVSS